MNYIPSIYIESNNSSHMNRGNSQLNIIINLTIVVVVVVRTLVGGMDARGHG